MGEKRGIYVLLQPFAWLYRKTLQKPLQYFGRAYPYPLKIFRTAIACFGIFAVLLCCLYLLILSGITGHIPSENDLGQINNYTASEVFSSDSVLIGKYFIENRTNAEYADFPPYLIQALVATEDARFYSHHGVDYTSFFRVLAFSVFLNSDAGGGSTITQQLAKNLYGRKDYGPLTILINKFREMIIAHRLENVYNKEEILTLYLNTVPFGEDCYGIESAAFRFFNTTPSGLNLDQSAVLVGLLKANTAYNPRINPEQSLQRRNVVLEQMRRYRYLSDSACDTLRKLPLALDYHPEGADVGLAPYFREYVRQYMESWAKENPKPDGTRWNIYTDGLHIYTTIDSRLQGFAEQAVREQMSGLQKTFDAHWKKSQPWGKSNAVPLSAMKRSDRYLHMKSQGYSEKGIQKHFNDTVSTQLFTWNGTEDTVMTPMDSLLYTLKILETGFLAMDPVSGQILAWVGGDDFRYFKYDHVLSKRQVGSTFKPILYATALEQGIQPCAYLPNEVKEYNLPNGQTWSPENAEAKYGGMYSMMGGLTYSVNTIAAQIMDETGVQNVVSMAQQMGITSKLPAVPSLALGTASISLYEMVSAYCCFVNNGYPVTPVFVHMITDRNGDTLFIQPQSPKTSPVMSRETAALMIQMMKSVVNSGTAARLRSMYGLSTDIAGKTGTTQNNTDGWFIGMTPKLVAGCWVGAEDPAVHWRSTALGQGAATALPVFARFMQQVYRDPETRHQQTGSFPTPPDSVMARIDCPLWLPDSLSIDSTGFIRNVIHNLLEILGNKNAHMDTVQIKNPTH